MTTIQERQQLLIDVLEHVSLAKPQGPMQTKAFPVVMARVLATIADPRITEPFPVPQRNPFISCIRKNKTLWARVRPFVCAETSWRTKCKCEHGYMRHFDNLEAGARRCSMPDCKCKDFEAKGF